MFSVCLRSIALVSLALLLTCWPSLGRADVPVFGDSFRYTAPDHAPGSPVHGASLERGHGRWEGTPGLYFDDGGVKGAGAEEYARFDFVPENHSRSARVFFEATIDPGSNGWSGVGFTNGEDGPLPTVGQIWIKIDDQGRVEVRADGASNLLFKDSQQNLAFTAGMNRIRIEYNRRANSARAWLNGVELPLGALDKHGFIPEIRAAALQLKDNGGDLKTKAIGDGGIGGVTVGMAGALLGDEFSTVLRLGVNQGDPLDGVVAQVGNEAWSATPSVGFGQEYATNIDLGSAVATLPFNPGDHPGYAASSVEAMINPADSDWLAIGFSSTSTGSFEQDGAVWARLFSDSGDLQIYALGTTYLLHDDQVVDPEVLAGGIPVRLTYNRVDGSVRMDIGESEMGIDPILVNLPTGMYPLAVSTGGFEASSDGGFGDTNDFAVDDFAIRVGEDIPPISFVEHPETVEVVHGGYAEFHCAASGGVPPYQYQWQLQGHDAEEVTWDPVIDGQAGATGSDTQNLVIYPATSDNSGRYRCLVTDSNSIPGELPSAEAALFVQDPITVDSFTTGGTTGRVEGSVLNGETPEFGTGPWSASTGAVLGEDVLTNQPAGGHVLAEVPITPSMTATFKVLSTSANIVVGDSDWIGVGFSTSDLVSFFTPGTGLLWARVTNAGRVVVLADSTVLFAQYILTPEQVLLPVHVRVEYNSETDTPRVWINDLELALNQTGALGPFGAAGINAGRGAGFGQPEMFIIDDFALTGSEEIPYPAFTSELPQSQSVNLGAEITLNCGATGGLDPLTFEWYRPSGPITNDDHYTITTGNFSTSLRITDFHPSLDGLYQCLVTDSRYGDPKPIRATASIRSILPDFQILWRRAAGEFVFVADARLGGVRQNWLRTGQAYDIEVVVGGNSEVDPSLFVPVTIYGACHRPGVMYEPPYVPIGSVTVPANWGHIPVPIQVPGDCLGDAPWGLLSLIADVNAESDPANPHGYPDYITYGRPHVPENGFGGDNRQGLQSWIPVAAGDSLLGAVGDGIDSKEWEFNISTDAPDPTTYPTEWTMASVQYGEHNDTLTFHLNPWDPCYEISEVFPEPYRPYLGFDTEHEWAAVQGAMTRHLMAGAYAGFDDSLYIGTTPGKPSPPHVDLEDFTGTYGPGDIADVAVLGPDGAGSANLLSWVFNRQFHVLVWNGQDADLFIDTNTDDHTDGVSRMETPTLEDGTPLVVSGDNMWLYLGFNEAGLRTWGDGVACDTRNLEWYYIDSIRVWGTGEPDPEPEQVDYSAGFIKRDVDGEIEPMPDAVLPDSEHRICIDMQAHPPDEEPPAYFAGVGGVEIGIATMCGDTEPSVAEYEVFQTDIARVSSNGNSVHCIVDGAGAPVSFTFSEFTDPCSVNPDDPQRYVIKGCLPDDYDIYDDNNCSLVLHEVWVDEGCSVPTVRLP